MVVAGAVVGVGVAGAVVGVGVAGAVVRVVVECAAVRVVVEGEVVVGCRAGSTPGAEAQPEVVEIA
jgi:hypothetical protein